MGSPAKKIKKIIPKEIAPAAPFIASAFVPAGGLGILGKAGLEKGLMREVLSKALVSGATSKATGDDTKSALRAAVLAGAQPAASQFASDVFRGAAPGGMLEKVGGGISSFLEPSTLGGQAKLVGTQTAIAAVPKAMELNEKALRDYEAQLREQGIADKAGRRNAIFGYFSRAGYSDTEINSMLDKYGYKDGGRVNYNKGGKVTISREEYERLLKDEDEDFDLGSLQAGIGGLETAFGRSFMAQPKPVPMMRFADGGITSTKKAKVYMTDDNSGVQYLDSEGNPITKEEFFKGTDEAEREGKAMGGIMKKAGSKIIEKFIRPAKVKMGAVNPRDELDRAVENINLDMADPEYSSHMIAEELAEIRYKTDYYDLSPKLQQDLYNEAADKISDIQADYMDYMYDASRDGMAMGGIMKKAGKELMKRIVQPAKRKIGQMTDDVEIDVNFDGDMYDDGTSYGITEINILPKTKKGKEALDQAVKEGSAEMSSDGSYFVKDVEEVSGLLYEKGIKASGVSKPGYSKGRQFERFDEGASQYDYFPGKDYSIEVFENLARKRKADGGIMNVSDLNNERFLEQRAEQYMEEGFSPEDAMDKALDDLKNNRFPALKDGGMMNLGGREMDMRGGGFIPIGKKERADDVPARLSKNEFVMTADAVRGAGNGSINKGAKRMYDLMNKLESKV